MVAVPAAAAAVARGQGSADGRTVVARVEVPVEGGIGMAAAVEMARGGEDRGPDRGHGQAATGVEAHKSSSLVLSTFHQRVFLFSLYLCLGHANIVL